MVESACLIPNPPAPKNLRLLLCTPRAEKPAALATTFSFLYLFFPPFFFGLNAAIHLCFSSGWCYSSGLFHRHMGGVETFVVDLMQAYPK
jgi:hypothetical protein